MFYPYDPNGLAGFVTSLNINIQKNIDRFVLFKQKDRNKKKATHALSRKMHMKQT